MRRFLTLAAISFSALITVPAFAAYPGGGNAGSNRPHSSERGDAYRGDSSQHGNPGYRSGERGGPYRPAPVVDVLTRSELRQAQRLQTRFQTERSQLMRQLRQAERRFERLQSRPRVRPAMLRAARLEVLRLEQKLSFLTSRHHQRLGALLNPFQLRYFLSLS